MATKNPVHGIVDSSPVTLFEFFMFSAMYAQQSFLVAYSQTSNDQVINKSLLKSQLNNFSPEKKENFKQKKVVEF